jgi:hypothetical protein
LKTHHPTAKNGPRERCGKQRNTIYFDSLYSQALQIPHAILLVIHLTASFPCRPDQDLLESNLLVEGLGVGGGGRNVGIAGSLVGAGGELELVGSLEVGVTGLAVGSGVILEVEQLGDHLQRETEKISATSLKRIG